MVGKDRVTMKFLIDELEQKSCPASGRIQLIEGHRIGLEEARWNNGFFAKQVMRHAGNAGAVLMSYMCVECRHIPKHEFAMTGMKSSKGMAGIWCSNGGAEFANNSYGCVVSVDHAIASRHGKVFRAFSPQQEVGANVTSAWTLANHLHASEGKTGIFQGLSKTSGGNLANN